MNALELLNRYGYAEPADDAVITAAAEAIRGAPEFANEDGRRHLRRHRRPWQAAGTLGIAAVAAVAALIVATTISNSPGPNSPTHLRTFTTAFVIRATTTALANTSDDIVEIQESVTPGGPMTSWFDVANGDLRTDYFQSGQLVDTSFDVGAAETVIDYQNHEYYDATPPNVITVFSQTPQAIEKELETGVFTLAEQQTIAGQSTLELTSDTGSTTVDLWVNPTTFLPVQETEVGTGNSHQMTFTWSGATPSATSIFNVNIPAGYTQVDEPPEP